MQKTPFNKLINQNKENTHILEDQSPATICEQYASEMLGFLFHDFLGVIFILPSRTGAPA